MKPLLLALAFLCTVAATTSAQPLVVTPKETDELLANPGMGWQTFQRPAKQDKNLPAWLPSSVYYIRWGWRDVEPRPGELDVALIERHLALARESGQKLAFRVMCASTYKGRPYHPAWLTGAGGREVVTDYEGDGPLPVPDLDHPPTLEKHLDLIRRLGQRFDGHPDLDHVDLGSVGWWGEWHMSGSKIAKMPTAENRRKVVDAYLTSFKKTPLLMLIGGGDDLAYAAGKGAGWRADCLGDMGGFGKNWSHMARGYPDYIRKAGLEETWRTAPVAWESCWDMRKWVSEGWSIRHIFNYALACHGSYLNNKSAPLPDGPEVRAEVERFVRRLGYRLVLRELSHPPRARAGEALALSTKWQNVGSAPCYRPYRVAYRLTDAAGKSVVLAGDVKVSRWRPGSLPLFTPEFMKAAPDLPPGEVKAETDRVTLPPDLPAGTYTLSVGIVDDASKPPVVRLAIEGRDKDGWYPLSRIEVDR